MFKAKVVLFAITFLSAFNAYALSFEIDNAEKLSASEIISAQMLFAKVQELIPQKMADTLNDSILVEFIDKGDKGIVVSCGEGKVTTKFFGATINVFNSQKIQMNKAFLNYIDSDKNGTNEYKCKHKSVFAEAVATLLHESFHVYENILASRHLQRLSGTNSFQEKIFKMNNHLVEKSADSYEFSSPAESIAVNFEYFILDPEFKCRKPSLYEYYYLKLEHAPFFDYECNTVEAFKLATNSKLFHSRKDRLYRVDYLLAGPGSDFASSFGHSMLRLAFCAPNTTFGPDCLKDISSHLVLSFRASTGSEATSYIKGLNGTYPSMLYAIPFSKVIDEYTRDEFRDIFTYPLKLSAEQITDLLTKALELHWTYSGKYYFISNNCAVETTTLIQSILPANHPFKRMGAKLPNTLRDNLISANLIDDFDVNDKSLVGKNVFPTTFKNDLNKAFLTIKPLLPESIKTYEDYIIKTTSAERLAWFKSPLKAKNSQMSFFLLENLINKDFNPKITASLMKLVKAKKITTEEQEILQKHAVSQSNLSPWNITAKNTYGLPLANEIDETIGLKLFDEYEKSNIKVVKILKSYDKLLADDFEQNQLNLKIFFGLKK